MRVTRLPYETGALADFFEAGLTALGAVCERTWHDRLRVLAEGSPAALWSPEQAWVDTELRFVPPSETGPRDAAAEVFAGCPLVFRLAEALRPRPLRVERVALAWEPQVRPPEVGVLEKLWRAQWPLAGRWSLDGVPTRGWSFGLLALIRLEIQAFDQQWSLYSTGVSLPGGARDDRLSRTFAHGTFADASAAAAIEWPAVDWPSWRPLLEQATLEDAATELAAVRARQQIRLQRELDRVDAYFDRYEAELRARAARARTEQSSLRLKERLEAAAAERERHRSDQAARHAVVVRPHPDLLLCIAEPAWQVAVRTESGRTLTHHSARFLPAARRWEMVTSREG